MNTSSISECFPKHAFKTTNLRSIFLFFYQAVQWLDSSEYGIKFVQRALKTDGKEKHM